MTWIYPTLSILSAASLAGAVWVHRHRKTRARLGTREDVQDRARRGGYRLMDTEELAA